MYAIDKPYGPYHGTCFITEIQLNWIFWLDNNFCFLYPNTMPNRQVASLHKGRRRK